MGRINKLPGYMRGSAGIFSLSLLLLIFWVMPARGADVCTTIIADSFEVIPSPWEQDSTNFGTPLCTEDLCGTGGDGIGPRTGDWWAWFGGISNFEEGSLEQSITMPVPGIARLQFYLWNKEAGNNEDFLKVKLDGAELFSSLASDPLYTAGYTLVTLDLAAYADGLAHTLRFESTTFGPENSNIFVDDFSMAMATNNWFMNYTSALQEMNDLLQPVLDSAADGQEIRGQAHLSNENVVFNPLGAVSLTIRGGFTCDFASIAEGTMTSISSLEVRGGTLVLENIEII